MTKNVLYLEYQRKEKKKIKKKEGIYNILANNNNVVENTT